MAKEKKSDSGGAQPIIAIKKIKKGGGGHHGGAWKVAYADFVTAMMAFFLLLWLLNVTTEEQKLAISNFFDPTHPQISESMSGAGGVMGGTAVSTEGAMSSTVQEIRLPQNSGKTTKGENRGDVSAENKDLKSAKIEELKDELRRREDERFKQAKQDLEREIEKTPELAEL
ncbi:MAG TPA: flagellar motor protein MotB, partial [Micavibrio sp.]